MRKSEIVFGPTGDVRYRDLRSGPLKAGETLLRIDVQQPEGTVLNEEHLALLRQQTEAFLSTLGESLQLGDEFILGRLKREVRLETWHDLLSLDSDCAYWLIQAWTAEARLADELCLHGEESRQIDSGSLIAILSRWAGALQFSDIIGFRREDRADWRHVAANARAQAALHRRRAKLLVPGSRSAGPRPLLPRLRPRLALGKRLLLLGLKTAPPFDLSLHDLLDRHAELILADSVEAGPKRFAHEISDKLYAAALILPEVPTALGSEIARACRVHGLACVQLLYRTPDDLERCLSDLDSALQVTTCRSA